MRDNKATRFSRSNIKFLNFKKERKKKYWTIQSSKHNSNRAGISENEREIGIQCNAYPGSWLSMSQISMFMAQSGPMSMSLVARSTIEFTISAHHQKESDPNIKPLPANDTHFPGEIAENSGDTTEYYGYTLSPSRSTRSLRFLLFRWETIFVFLSSFFFLFSFSIFGSEVK